MNRLEANREVLKLLTACVEKYPSLRFGQILTSLDVILTKRDADGCVVGWHDEYNTESIIVLSRARSAMAVLNSTEPVINECPEECYEEPRYCRECQREVNHIVTNKDSSCVGCGRLSKP